MHPVRRLLRRAGIDVARHRPHFDDAWRRARLLERVEADVLLDVGANVGAYAQAVRASGYAGRIVSFEPVSAAFSELERAAAADPLWEAWRVALGRETARAQINVGALTTTSSLLATRPEMRRSEQWATVAAEEVDVMPLDALGLEFERAFLKLDTQGTELDVLAGARTSLSRVAAVEIELAFEPFYEGQPPLARLVDELDRLGFRIVSFAPGWVDPRNGEMGYVDALFRQRDGSR